MKKINKLLLIGLSSLLCYGSIGCKNDPKISGTIIKEIDKSGISDSYLFELPNHRLKKLNVNIGPIDLMQNNRSNFIPGDSIEFQYFFFKKYFGQNISIKKNRVHKIENHEINQNLTNVIGEFLSANDIQIQYPGYPGHVKIEPSFFYKFDILIRNKEKIETLYFTSCDEQSLKKNMEDISRVNGYFRFNVRGNYVNEFTYFSPKSDTIKSELKGRIKEMDYIDGKINLKLKSGSKVFNLICNSSVVENYIFKTLKIKENDCIDVMLSSFYKSEDEKIDSCFWIVNRTDILYPKPKRKRHYDFEFGTQSRGNGFDYFGIGEKLGNARRGLGSLRDALNHDFPN